MELEILSVGKPGSPSVFVWSESGRKRISENVCRYKNLSDMEVWGQTLILGPKKSPKLVYRPRYISFNIGNDS